MFVTFLVCVEAHLMVCPEHFLRIESKMAILWLTLYVIVAPADSAVTCDFQQLGILTSVDSDEPLQPPVKLRNFK